MESDQIQTGNQLDVGVDVIGNDTAGISDIRLLVLYHNRGRNQAVRQNMDSAVILSMYDDLPVDLHPVSGLQQWKASIYAVEKASSILDDGRCCMVCADSSHLIYRHCHDDESRLEGCDSAGISQSNGFVSSQSLPGSSYDGSISQSAIGYECMP